MTVIEIRMDDTRTYGPWCPLTFDEYSLQVEALAIREDMRRAEHWAGRRPSWQARQEVAW